MKNFKSIFSSVSIIVIAFIIHLSTAGFTTETPVTEKSIADKPSTYCTFNIVVSTMYIGCLTEDYKMCINGGSTTTVSGSFTVDVPCDRAYTVCVTSGNGCTGSIVLNADCPCSGGITYLYIGNTGIPCECS